MKAFGGMRVASAQRLERATDEWKQETARIATVNMKLLFCPLSFVSRDILSVDMRTD
jgi:hypothetical protein